MEIYLGRTIGIISPSVYLNNTTFEIGHINTDFNFNGFSRPLSGSLKAQLGLWGWGNVPPAIHPVMLLASMG